MRIPARSEEMRRCPRCGKIYQGRPVMSREDNATPICPTCGTREALLSLGLKQDEIEQIISQIPKENQ